MVDSVLIAMVTLVCGMILSHILAASPVVFRYSVLKNYIHSSLLSNLACQASTECQTVNADISQGVPIMRKVRRIVKLKCVTFKGIFNMCKLTFFEYKMIIFWKFSLPAEYSIVK